jgi:uncharacterized membrane protein
MELHFQMAFLILASLFTGIALFLSTVLRETFNALTTEQYHAVYSEVIVRGRKSIFINAIIIVPILLFLSYLICGFRNPFFISGSLLYILGSFGASTLINEPAYTKLLEIDIKEQTGIIEIRTLLNKGNITRAILSLLGILLIGISIY